MDTRTIKTAVKELVANIMEHAYEENDSPRCWVIFGRAEEEENFTIVVGDLGRTIPATIKKHSTIEALIARKEWKTVKKIMANDFKLIEYATRISETQTLEKHRGKGLGQTINKIRGLNGYLAIYSRRGLYKVGLSRKEIRSWKKINIQGTIAEINIPLNRN